MSSPGSPVRLQDPLDEVCNLCGFRYGDHSSGEPSRCPPGWGRHDWDNGPLTVFEPSGTYRSVGSYTGAEIARNMPAPSRTDPYGEVCGRCGCSRGAHSTSLHGAIRCPSSEHGGLNVWTETRAFIPTGRYDAVPHGMFALDLQTAAPPPIVEEQPESSPSNEGEEGGPTEMGWIMVSGSERHLTTLCAAGITASMATIVSPFEFQGIVFPETELEKVKESGIVTVYDTLVLTSTDGLRLSLSQEDVERIAEIEKARTEEEQQRMARKRKEEKEGKKDEYRVTEDSVGGLEYYETMQPVLQKYAQQLKKHIRILNSHNSGCDWIQPEEGALRIVFWAGMGSGGAKIYDSVFGVSLSDGQNDGMNVDKNTADYDIIDSQGLLVGQVVGNILTIPFDLPHGSSAGKVLTRILDAYMKLKIDPSKVDLKSKRAEQMEKLLASVATRAIESNKAALRSKMVDIESYTTAISSLLAQATAIKQIVQALTEKKDRMKEEGSRIINGLLEMDKVKDVMIRGDMVIVTTEHLDFMYKGKMYKGHKYGINLSPTKGVMTIGKVDMEPLIQGYTHPHINSSGSPCLGNIKKGAFEFLTGFELVPLVDLLIQYLQVANETDWYLDPVKWPLVGGTPVENATMPESSTASATVVESVSTPQAEEEPALHHCRNCGENYDNDDDWCSACGYCTGCCACSFEEEEEEEEEEEV
jgi:hypothetical protein